MIWASPEPLLLAAGTSQSDEVLLVLLEDSEIAWSQVGGPTPERVEALTQALRPPDLSPSAP